MPESAWNINLILNAAIEAGEATLKYFKKDIEVKHKSDSSPLTMADMDSNSIIENYLLPIGIPIISEETASTDYCIRKQWKKFWLIDPLDGTKEFIAGNPDFTINIALIENNYPAFGVVYLPVTDILYYGSKDIGAFKRTDASRKILRNPNPPGKDIRLPYLKNTCKTVVVASRTHNNKETIELIQKAKSIFTTIEIESYGSSLKLCMIAEGKADFYPRLGPTMEWDIAAAHAIVNASGNKLLQYPSLEKLNYNKENLLNPWFIALANEKENAIKEILLLH
jgi:3'(2'), 5'-bisphosphate nucleotidase